MADPAVLTALRDRLRAASGADELRSLVSPLTKALTAIAGEAEYPSIAVLVSDALGFKCSGTGHVEVGAALALVAKLLPSARCITFDDQAPTCGAFIFDARRSAGEIGTTRPLAILCALLSALASLPDTKGR